MNSERSGFKKATKAEREKYLRWASTGEGEVPAGSVFDGRNLWVRNTSSNTAAQNESSKDKDSDK